MHIREDIVGDLNRKDVPALREAGVSDDDIAHCQAVAEKALEVAGRTGAAVDMELVGRGALFHDLAGSPSLSCKAVYIVCGATGVLGLLMVLRLPGGKIRTGEKKTWRQDLMSGISAFGVGFFLSAQIVTLAVTKPLMGNLSDRHGRPPQIVAGAFLGAASIGILPLAGSFVPMLAISVLFGLSLSVMTSATSAFIADNSLRVPLLELLIAEAF